MSTINSNANILVADSDENIAELLCVNLRAEGYSVEHVSHSEAIMARDLGSVRLIIADSMKEDYTGLDLVYDIKDNPQTEHISVIICTTVRSERLVIDVLDAGADDYIVKPFSLREFVARVKGILRRQKRVAAPSSGSRLEIGDISVDMPTQTVMKGDQVLNLSRIEYAILTLLLKNMNTYVSRAEIHRSVWPDENAVANERVVDTNISRLRKKLGETGNRITTRSGHGYMIS